MHEGGKIIARSSVGQLSTPFDNGHEREFTTATRTSLH
jgi:hypothetical protein